MKHAWDKPLRCGLQFKEPLAADQYAPLEEAGVELNMGYGKIEKSAHATVKLSHLYCLAELGIVKQLECEQPSPVLQWRLPNSAHPLRSDGETVGHVTRH